MTAAPSRAMIRSSQRSACSITANLSSRSLPRRTMRRVGTLAIAAPEHLYLETQAALAIPDDQGGMRVHSSTQHASHVGRVIARMLGIAEAQVVCECRRAGG